MDKVTWKTLSLLCQELLFGEFVEIFLSGY